MSLENELINLRLTSKQQQRGALKCKKNEATQKTKLREAIKAGNIEGARIYGQNAIREKNQALNCLRLSSRIDAVASRLETAIRMKQVDDGGVSALGWAFVVYLPNCSATGKKSKRRSVRVGRRVPEQSSQAHLLGATLHLVNLLFRAPSSARCRSVALP